MSENTLSNTLPNICLNMIVKNESKTLPRMFASLHDSIDYYVILDTGSTDGTPELIKKLMDGYGVKGEIYHSDWVNFAHCRNIALNHAVGKAKFALIIDADEELRTLNDDCFKNLDNDSYLLLRRLGSAEYYLNGLVNISNNNELKWEWKGVVHNYLSCGNKSRGVKQKKLDTMWILSHSSEGAKSHNVTAKEKYLRDANMLIDELKKNPTDTRSQFYLAQSYRDASETEQAIEHYQKRAKMGGWTEEVFYSYYMVGKLSITMKANFDQISDVLMKAYYLMPNRIESIYYLVNYCRTHKMYYMGYFIGKQCVNIRNTDAILFVDKWIYDYALLDDYSICAYWANDFKECVRCSEILLKDKLMPEHYTQRIEKNLQYAKEKLK